MLESLKKYKVSIIVLVLIAGGIYAYITYGPERLPDGLLTSSAPDGGTVAGQEIVQILVDIRKIELDTEIFENEEFRNLVDRRREVIGEPQGRRNPFEPIGFGVNIGGVIAEPNEFIDVITIDDAIYIEDYEDIPTTYDTTDTENDVVDTEDDVGEDEF